MERIVIEVDNETARNWRAASLNVKSYLEKNFEEQINEISEKLRMNSFEKLLAEAREEADKNGLTEEILQQLLNEEE